MLATLLMVGSGGWTPPRNDPAGLTYVGVWVAPALFTGLGVVIATRQPGNRVARLFLIVGLSLLLSVWADLKLSLVAPEQVSASHALAVIWYNTWFIAGFMVPVLLLMFLFPSGKFLTKRWSWAGWAAGLAVITALFAESFVERLSPHFGPDIDAWTIPNPIGFLDTGTMEHPPYVFILGASVLSLAFGAVAALVVRYTRSSALVRAQIRWVVYALCLFVVIGLTSTTLGIYGLGLVISMMLIPVSVSVAISRYKLFEIDRLISRTVSYTIVVGLLALVFTTGVAWMQSILGIEDDALLVAASTLAVAALFNPLRKRVQHHVDRRFNRAAYQVEEIKGQFSIRLHESLDVDELSKLLIQTTTESLQPEAAGIWLNPEYSDTAHNRRS